MYSFSEQYKATKSIIDLGHYNDPSWVKETLSSIKELKKLLPKNYNIKVKTSVIATSPTGNEVSKIFERTISLAAQTKKIDEKELESKHKEDISDLIGKDIIFLLTTSN